MLPRRPRPRPLAAALLAAALPLAACGADDVPTGTPGPEVRGGDAGPDEMVTEDVTLADVELPYPEDGVWSAGEDVPLHFALTNTGSEPVALGAITGEDFADVLVTSEDGDGDDAALVVAEDDNLYVDATDLPSVVLVDLDLDLRSSLSIPVTFTFENGPEVAVDAVVGAATGTDVPEPDEDPTPGR